MCGRFAPIAILTSISLCLILISAAKHKKLHHGPGGMAPNDIMTCKQFAKYARFNPYSVLRQWWFVFYYWGPPRPQESFIFNFPTTNQTRQLKKIYTNKTIIPVDWNRRHFLMIDDYNETNLLVERGDRGEYWLFPLQKTKGVKIRPIDIRLKQIGTDNNTLIGLMDCDKERILAMSKIEHVPPQNRLQDEAARLGYRGRRGKSYLYQGHEWMPIPEEKESNYWYYEKQSKEREKVWNEESSSEEKSEEVRDKTDKSSEADDFNKDKVKDQKVRETANLQKSKEKLDRQETNVIEDVKPKDDQDSALPNKETVDTFNYESENMQVQSKESVKVQTTDSVTDQTTEPRDLENEIEESETTKQAHRQSSDSDLAKILPSVEVEDIEPQTIFSNTNFNDPHPTQKTTIAETSTLEESVTQDNETEK